MNNDQYEASLINLDEKVTLKFDRLSQCYNEPNPEFVKTTCGLLLDDHYQKNIPGMRVTANARYHVSCQIPVPFSGVKKASSPLKRAHVAQVYRHSASILTPPNFHFPA